MEVKDVKDALAEGLKPVAEEVKAAKTAAEAAQGEIKTVKEEVTGLNEWKVKKDEADKKNQEALDQLIADGKKKKVNTQEGKGFNQLLADEIKAKTDDIKKLQEKSINNLSFEVKAVGDMTFANSFPTASASIADVRQGIVGPPNRKVHVRDLLPAGTTTGGNIVFIKETGGEGAPAPQTEGSAKAKLDIDLAEDIAPVRTLAAILKISRQMLDDVPALISYLQNRLTEKLLRVEDDQLLNGNGTAPNVKGLFTVASAATSTATIDIEQLIYAFAQLESNDYDATAGLIGVQTYYGILTNKASGSGEYDLPGIVSFVNGVLYVAGRPIFASTALADDAGLVGDWQMGAQLFTRQGINVQFFDQNVDDVEKNMVTVRVEERVAMPIYQPGAFVKIDFSEA